MNASATAVTIVKPASARVESLVILAFALVLAAGTFLLARINAPREQNTLMADWQVSAFRDLSPVDQSLFSTLTFAGTIIQVWYDDALASGDPRWTTVEELQHAEFGLEPFMHDLNWKQNGELRWQLITSYGLDGATVYFGSGGKVPGQSAYLLVISHLHKGATFTNQSIVWVHPNANVAAPETVNLDSLVRNGWKQVVKYSGADEVKRLRGEG